MVKKTKQKIFAKEKTHFIERILPSILVWFTGHGRYKVRKLEWCNKLITPNLFRLFEFFFWRRLGKSNRVGDIICIETEMHVKTLEDGRTLVTRKFYTWEALVGEIEYRIYQSILSPIKKVHNLFRKLEWKLERFAGNFEKVFETFSPQFSIVGVSSFPATEQKPKGYMFAIAYENVIDGQEATSGTKNIAFNAGTNANRTVIFSGSGGAGFTATSSYNAVALIDIFGAQLYANSTGTVYLMYLLNAASGSNTLQIVQNGNDNYYIASYSGTNTSSLDATSLNDIANASPSEDQSTFTVTYTVSANSWIAGVFFGGGTVTATGVLSLRSTGRGANSVFMDSNGALAAGSRTASMTIPSASYGVFSTLAMKTDSNAYTATITETVATSEQKVNTWAATLEKLQTALLSDLTTLSKISTILQNETVYVTDVVSVFNGKIISTIEQVNLSDSVTLIKALNHTITETVSLSDQTARVLAFSTSIVETVALTDVLTRNSFWSFKTKHGSGSDWTFRNKS